MNNYFDDIVEEDKAMKKKKGGFFSAFGRNVAAGAKATVAGIQKYNEGTQKRNMEYKKSQIENLKYEDKVSALTLKIEKRKAQLSQFKQEPPKFRLM